MGSVNIGEYHLPVKQQNKKKLPSDTVFFTGMYPQNHVVYSVNLRNIDESQIHLDFIIVYTTNCFTKVNDSMLTVLWNKMILFRQLHKKIMIPC